MISHMQGADRRAKEMKKGQPESNPNPVDPENGSQQERNKKQQENISQNHEGHRRNQQDDEPEIKRGRLLGLVPGQRQ